MWNLENHCNWVIFSSKLLPDNNNSGDNRLDEMLTTRESYLDNGNQEVDETLFFAVTNALFRGSSRRDSSIMTIRFLEMLFG